MESISHVVMFSPDRAERAAASSRCLHVPGCAVPNVFPRHSIKSSDDSRDLSRRTKNRVFPACFTGNRQQRTIRVHKLAVGFVFLGVEGAAIEQLKMHGVQVNRMSINGGVHELPNFGSSNFGIFGD